MRHWVTTCLAVATAAVVTVAAQQNATLTLASGERLQGQLVDLGGSGFTFRVNGQDRQIPRGDVRVIDFGDPAADAPDPAKNLPAGTNLLVLRNGETVQGEFYDVGGTTPLRITFRTSGGERTVNADEVQRIYMTRVDGGDSAGGSGGSLQGQTITVSARTRWTPTNITVSRGQTVRFQASGEIRFSPRGHVATPAGSQDGLFDSNAPMPSVPQGALIGRVGGSGRGGGSVFQIGSQESVVMPADGQLFLSVNDSGLNDNSGAFTVVVAPQ